MEKPGEFTPEERKEDRSTTAWGARQPWGCPRHFHQAASAAGQGMTASTLPGIFTLSVSGHWEQGLDVKEKKYGLKNELSSRIALQDGSHTLLRTPDDAGPRDWQGVLLCDPKRSTLETILVTDQHK